MSKQTYLIIAHKLLFLLPLVLLIQNGLANESQTLSNPLLLGTLVRTSVITRSGNDKALPEATIGHAKNHAKQRSQQLNLFSNSGTNKYILEMRAEMQNWQCIKHGKPAHIKGREYYYRIGHLSDTFSFTLQQIRPHKQRVFETSIPVHDRQLYQMKNMCLKGWREKQSQRAALQAIDIFMLQLMQHAGLNVTKAIQTQTQSMHQLKPLGFSDKLLSGLIHTVEAGKSLASEISSTANGIGTAITESQNHKDSRSTPSSSHFNPYYLAAKISNHERLPSTVKSSQLDSAHDGRLTLSTNKKIIEAIDCNETLFTSEMHWDGKSCRRGAVSEFATLQFKALGMCRENPTLSRLDNNHRQRCLNGEGENWALIFSDIKKTGKTINGLTQYQYTRKYKCSCEATKINHSEGSTVTR